MTLCFYVGSLAEFNVQKDVENMGKALHREFDLHLLTTKPDTYDGQINELFTVFGGKYESSLIGELKTLQKYLKEESPVCITTVSMQQDMTIPAAIMAQIAEIPHIYRYTSDDFIRYTVHSGWRRPAYFFLKNIIGRITLPLSSKYLVLGPTGQEHLQNRGVALSDIEVLPQPIDASRFKHVDDPSSFPVSNDVPIGLFVGRRVWIKGYDILERALPEILEKRPDLHFILIGCGKDYPNIDSQFYDRIHPIGQVDPAIIPTYFSRADVLLVTSRSEGLPRVVLEALLAGTPVIAPPVGEIPHVVSNPYSDINELIDRVCNFEDEPLDDAQDYTIEHLKEDYHEFYRQFTNNIPL